jgi:flagellar hook-associated protein 3 FlgL
MSITGPGSITAANALAQTNMMNQLTTLSEQLGTGQAAQTYSGLTSQAGLALQLNAQLSAIDGYSQTASAVGTTLTVAQSVLTQLGSTQSSVKQSLNQQLPFSLNNNGQTVEQQTAATQLDQILSLLNTQAGNSYLFSGSAVNQPSVADTNEILNGNGAQAGLKQVISERQQADLGNGLGRLVIPAASGSTVSISEDVAGSPFGMKLAGASSTLTGATVTGPSGSPPALSVSLGSDPNNGDAIQFAFTMPDGTTQNVTLQATSSTTPGTNQFSIVSGNTAATAANLQAALTTAVTNLAQTALPASSAIAAANNFFSSAPPQRVDPGSPPDFATATSLVNGTPANTVFWYTGENGSTPARQTATAQVGPSMIISYGMRANEQALSSLVANVAVLAATTYSTSDPNAKSSYQALSQEVTANLDGTPGTQQISDIEADLANAQTTASNATSLNTQTQSTLSDMLQGIDGVNQNQIGEQILTLQNSLSASMSVTARLAQLSLVNYLAPVSG